MNDENNPVYFAQIVAILAVIIAAVLAVPGLLEWMALGLIGAGVLLFVYKWLFE